MVVQQGSVPGTQKQERSKGGKFFLLFLLLAGFGIYQLTGDKGGKQDAQPIAQSPTAPAPAATVDKSAAMQAKRRELIDKLIKQGVFQKVEVPGSLPRIWVRPVFYTLDFDTKESFVSVVYAFYFDGSNASDMVRIFDSRSGKQVGRYSALIGGLKLD